MDDLIYIKFLDLIQSVIFASHIYSFLYIWDIICILIQNSYLYLKLQIFDLIIDENYENNGIEYAKNF